MPSSFPLLEARGTHRELGQQHGEQCRPQLLALLDYLAKTLDLTRQDLQNRALHFLPLFQKHCPHLVEEIHGLAEGARVSFAEALAVQIRGELKPVTMEACTTFVLAASATQKGEILIGQNSDVDPEFEKIGYILKLKPKGKPSLLMWTFGGQIGYHGMNSAGIAHFANSLGGGPSWNFALPHYPIKRLMLECTSLQEIFALLDRVPVCSNGNYVVCDGTGQIGDIELTTQGYTFLKDPGAGFLAHTNHYLCAPHACAANYEASVPDSFRRLDRMRTLLQEKLGRLTVNDLQQFLADHDGQPTSICRHPHAGPDHPSVSARGKTAASLITEPAQGRFHACRGNPCQNKFTTYELS
jgi:isopenicillin-N N-acyltransferase-like protein